MTNMIYMTAAYSNAVFKAVMPQFEAFIEKAGLPIPTPVPPAMIQQFRPPIFADSFTVQLKLTNRTGFLFGSGIVEYYTGPRNFDWDKQYGRWAEMQGTTKMTTNEMKTLITNFSHRLGYNLKDLTVGWTMKIEGPLGWEDGEHFFPFFSIEWENSSAPGGYARFCVDADRKEVVGMSIWSPKIRRPDPEIGVKPETWDQHREELEQRLKAAATNMTIELTPGAKRRRLPTEATETPPAPALPPPRPAPKQPEP